MFRSKILEQGKAMAAATVCAWRCPCWDCRSHRRHLLRLAAIGALMLGFTGGAAYGLGRGHASTGRAGAVSVEAAVVDSASLRAAGSRGG